MASHKKESVNSEDHVESFGVCAKNSSSGSDQRKFILHLRVHTNKKQPPVTTQEISSILPNNETYNDLMRYTPELSGTPVAYEQNSTDSYPEILKGIANATNGPQFATDGCTRKTPVVSNEHPHGTTSTHTSACVPVVPATVDVTESQQHCWWCTYGFGHEPFSMPIRLSNNNQYDTVGCFCSPECTASYIFANKSGVCDPWKQYEMLHRMVNKKHDGVEIRIKLAPPRETLQRYGGPYSISAYRSILQDYRKHVRVSMPPINPIQKMIEEVAVDYTKKRHKFLPIDSTRVKKAENELCLKRKKKQSSENTLEAFMRLRMGKTK